MSGSATGLGGFGANKFYLLRTLQQATRGNALSNRNLTIGFDFDKTSEMLAAWVGLMNLRSALKDYGEKLHRKRVWNPSGSKPFSRSGCGRNQSKVGENQGFELGQNGTRTQDGGEKQTQLNPIKLEFFIFSFENPGESPGWERKMRTRRVC